MNIKKSWTKVGGAIFGMLAPLTLTVMASEETGYLTYREPGANASAGTLSTVSYVFSLLLTFAIVVGLAYLASKFLSRRLAPAMQGSRMLIRDAVSLGANKTLYLVEIGNSVFLLGVTEQSITSVKEFTDEKFITELRTSGELFPGKTPANFPNIFQQQIDALQRMTGRISGSGKTD
ncbi:MAG TPA: flagellar biosynthesis protein FliO [Firmicutes bacterium]|nr:flagellar biosynthesis protein FliO [Bacillota bacterium]